ncbi:MAG: thioredoxin-like domain-containing protein [Verrucomicrobiota bacterium]|nr:thioredoxin-like domain-containing protein [Verrucomicrobiota bacterium]
MSHSFFNPFSWFSKAAAFALPLACLAVLGQAADLPPRSPQFTQLLEQLKAHVERVDQQADRLRAPAFPEGKDWFNSPPLSFDKQLAGKIVVLDFWTYCCINCIHVLPDLAELEERYAGYPVAFVGVHSAKFDNEKVSANIRDAVLRYEIAHPVVNDDTMQMWQRVGVRSWPSMAVVGPKGNLLLMVSGEGNKEAIDACISAALAFYPKKIFRHDPVPMSPEKDKQHIESPLRYPGKLAIDPNGQRLFISDSNHHRIVVTDLDGKFIDTIGSGRIGLADGGYDEAQFFRLQGLAYHDGRLYVADAENHALRVVDTNAKTVGTLIGNGMQGRDYQGGKGGRDQVISTPWDVFVEGDQVFIAMAGTHQIWSYGLKAKIAKNYSGNGSEQNLNRDDRLLAAWAQPSGLSVGNGELFIADSESSTVRSIDLTSGATRTIAGGENAQPRNLFAFGDKDGIGEAARMQHALGVLWWPSEQKVIVADTYNHRLKLVDPKTGEAKRWVGSGKPALRDGKGLQSQFSEPSGFALGPQARRLFVADTNNHVIRVVDLESLGVTTLKLSGVPAAIKPVAPRSLRLADLPGTPTIRTKPLLLAKGTTGTLNLSLKLPPNHHFTANAGSRWQVIADKASPLLVDEAKAAGALKENETIRIPVTLRGEANEGLMRVEAIAYFCKEDGPCQVSGVLFEVPVAPGQSPGKPVDLSHTFSNQATQFGLPIGGTP